MTTPSLQAASGELADLLQALFSPRALTELGVLLGCLLVSLLAVRLLRGTRRRTETAPRPTTMSSAPRGGVSKVAEPHLPTSIWFGRKLYDGVLFPALALLAALAARWALAGVLPTAVFKIAVPILLSLLLIRIGVRVLRVAFPKSPTVRIIERSLSWLVWIALVLWLTGILPLLLDELDDIRWKLGGANVSALSLLEGALSAAAVLVLMLWLSAAIEARLMAGAEGAGDSLSLRKIAANTTRAVLLLVGLLLALSAAGIPLGALGVLGGAVGVGIGLGLQKIASNYVSGFVILAERSLRIGDTVKVDNFEGRITDIHTRYTVVRALNGREAIVPNEMLVTQRVENASLANPRVSISTTLVVAYGTDLAGLSPVLVDAICRVPRVLAEPAPMVQLSQFASDGLELTIPFWIDDPENGNGNVRSDVNLAILQTLGALGVQIPCPQRVLHAAAPSGVAAAVDQRLPTA